MLNKLMKYDLKATSRLLVPLYLVLLLMSIINRFVFMINGSGSAARVISQFLEFTYFTTIFIVLVATVLYMIIRFYKNLLTDEGYLMFTLPAKTHDLIASKLIITVFWSIASIIAILISLFIVFATSDTLPSVLNGIKETLAGLNNEFGGSFAVMFIELIVLCLLSLVTNILLIYTSIAFGQLFSKHKIIGSFVSYFIIYTIIQFLLLVILIAFGGVISQNLGGISPSPQRIFPIILVILIIASTCFYLATNYILKRKLNLD